MTPDTRNALLAELDDVAERVRALRRRVAGTDGKPDEKRSLEICGAATRDIGTGFDAVLALVSKTTNLPASKLLSKRGSEPYCKARHAAYWLVLKLTGASMAEIAGCFKKRNPSTITYGIRKVDEKRSINPAYAEALDKMLEQLKNQKD
jgi:chromosomal replication initiation ATPase DnaA